MDGLMTNPEMTKYFTCSSLGRLCQPQCSVGWLRACTPFAAVGGFLSQALVSCHTETS